MTRFNSKFVFPAIAIGVSCSVANAEIVIDSFTDQFEAEEFAGSISAGIINSVFSSHSLDVGFLTTTNGAGIGDLFVPNPRVQEHQYQTGLSGVLGGSRDGTLTAGDPSSLGSAVNVRSFGGELSFSTGFSTSGILNLEYSADGLGLNLDAASQDATAINLISGDLDAPSNPRPVPFTISLTSGLGTANETTHSLGDSFFDDGTEYSFSLADYAAFGIDLSDIDVIALHIDQSDPSLAAADFRLGSLVIVPTPSSMAAISLFGMLAARRRRTMS